MYSYIINVENYNSYRCYATKRSNHPPGLISLDDGEDDVIDNNLTDRYNSIYLIALSNVLFYSFELTQPPYVSNSVDVCETSNRYRYMYIIIYNVLFMF